MLGSGFSNAPVSKTLHFILIGASILASITDSKHYFYIEIVPHLYPYRQLWRLLIWQLAYTSSTALLTASMTLYHLRLIERLWGSRKFASYLSFVYIITSLLSPFILAAILRPLSFKTFNYLPSGPTAVAFSLLAQYHAAIPHVYKYRIATSSSDSATNNDRRNATNSSTNADPAGLTFSDKSLTYLLAGQLALSEFPGSLLAASIGWIVGLAWRYEILLPRRVVEWRIPAWVVGEKRAAGTESVRAGGIEELRRRLEERGVQGLSSGRSDEAEGEARRRA